ncbi:hypothetical protein [Bifidobacterium pullorum]|uniref:hypothetical protein n=1 Tax=Bifidobacterium pullorum TaxID=78448 RepID=UPI00068F01FC|nr:hypothetical protein [Bifidobacterium pullorum]
MNCFNGAYAFQAFPAHLKAMKKKIAELSAKEMDSTDRDAWVDYFCSEYEIDLVVMYPESKDIDISEKTVQEYNTWYQISRDEPKFFDRPGYKVTCKVPFSGDPGLFELQPNPHTMGAYEVDRIIKPGKDGIGYLVLSYELLERDASAEGIEAHFSQEIGAIHTEVEKVNTEARRFNETIRGEVEKAIDERIRQVDKFARIRQGLNIPLNRVEGAPMARPVPLPKRKLCFSKPVPNTRGEVSCSITDVDYEAINAVISDCGALMEQAPSSFSSLDEEQLRDYLRGMLGTHYDNVTGETFRNRGKTDIHIPFGDHVAYIAECKIWHGKKAFLSAIEQLFSYSTWRDTKVSVIIFNKENKSFENVLESIQGALDEHAIRARSIKRGQWYCEIQNAEDERVMHVTVQAFNLHV